MVLLDSVLWDLNANAGLVPQTDYFGIAGTVYCMLFGTYMQVKQGPDGVWTTNAAFRRYRTVLCWLSAPCVRMSSSSSVWSVAVSPVTVVSVSFLLPCR